MSVVWKDVTRAVKMAVEKGVVLAEESDMLRVISMVLALVFSQAGTKEHLKAV